MTTKQYKLRNLEKFTLLAFQDRKNNSHENAIKNIRISLEAICKFIILEKRGEIQGDEIILGNRNGFTFAPISARAPDFSTLNDICKRHNYFDSNNNSNKNEKIFHWFDDIRRKSNNGAHDPNSEEYEVTQDDSNFCFAIFKNIINWFFNNFLSQTVPLVIKSALIGIIDANLLENYNNNEWNQLSKIVDGFSPTQKFILIAPPNFETLTNKQIDILNRINWHFVFDFSPKSKNTGGLFHSLTTNNPQIQVHPITIEQIRDENIISNSPLALNYFFANGLDSLPHTISNTSREWKRKKYVDFITSIIHNYVDFGAQYITLISLYDEIKYTRSIIEKFDEKISNIHLLKTVLLVQDNNNIPRIEDEFKDYECNIIELSHSDFVEGISKTIIPKTIKKGENLYQVPGKTPEGKDVLIDISQEYFSFLEKDIEILYHNIEQVNKIKLGDEFSFFKGNEISWSDIANDIPVRRDKKNDLKKILEDNLQKTKRGHTIELFHKPGSGGTTLALDTAYHFHTIYPTVIIKKFHKNKTNKALFDLASKTQKPIIAIIESHEVSRNDFDRLVRKINVDKKYVICIYVKRIFHDIKKLPSNSILLSEKMETLKERDRFTSKFIQISEDTKKSTIAKFKEKNPSQCEIIDFPLTAFEEEYKAGSLDKYILNYLNKLPTSQLAFAGFSSLLYYYTQKNISELWFFKLFPQKSLREELLLKPLNERFYEKLFLQEIDQNFQETGFWRPKYNRFATEILRLSLVGLNPDKKSNWQDYLSQWTIDFIKKIKESNDFLNADIKKILKSLILERDHEDLLGKDEKYEIETSNNKFSRLLKDIGDKDKQKQVLSTLIASYPYESHFRGHLGRFLYEKSKDESEFEEAERQIDIALELGENDYNLWHLKGMCNRRRIEYLLRSNLDEYTKDELLEFEEIIQELANNAIEGFEKSREINPYNLYSHTAQIQTLIQVIEFGRSISKQSNVNFLLDKKNIWYEERLNEIFDLLGEAQYNIELSKDLDRNRKLAQSKNMIDGCQGGVFKLLGDFSKAIDKYKNLADNADRAVRPYYRKMFVYSTLAQKVGNDPKKFYTAWEKLSIFESESLIKALESNIREQPENPHHIKLWLQAVRFSNSYMSLEDCISIAKTWADNSNGNEISNIEALYNLYVMYACKAINEGDSFSKETVSLAIEYLTKSSEISKNDRYSFEWYGSGSGVKCLVNHKQLGGMSSSTKFFHEDKIPLLKKVEGTITNIYSRQSGKLKLLCGLDCFFVPVHGGFEEGRDETTKVSFFVGFRQNGLNAWEVSRVENHPYPIEQEKTNILATINSNEIEIEGEIDEDFLLEETKEEIKEENNAINIHTNVTTLKGLTVKGKIDLSQFRKHKIKKK